MAGKVVMSPISCGRRSIPTILSDRNESGIKLFIDGPRERFFHGIVKYKVDGGKSGNESDFLRPPLDPYNFIRSERERHQTLHRWSTRALLPRNCKIQSRWREKW